MRVRILSVGRLKAGPERELAARYADRFAKLGRGIGFDLETPLELPESRLGNSRMRRRAEAAELVKAIPDRAAVLLLDERGEAFDSEHLAERIGDFRDAGRPALGLIVGGADGLDGALRERADLVVSFGRATWPHQLVRVMLGEQLYRAATILAGHPYHRGG